MLECNNDSIELEISIDGIVDNYKSLDQLSYEIVKMLDEWLVWNLDGDCDFSVTEV